MTQDQEISADELEEEVFLPSISDAERASFPVMSDRCSQCPGRKSPDDPEYRLTHALLAACKRRRHPFWCHMTSVKADGCTHFCREWHDNTAFEGGAQ